MRRDDAYLLDMLIAARDAISFLQGVSAEQVAESRIHQQAVTKALETIGEAAARGPKDHRDQCGRWQCRAMVYELARSH